MSRGTLDVTFKFKTFAYRVFTFCDLPSQTNSASLYLFYGYSSTPGGFLLLVWASALFARRYLGYLVLISFPPGT